MVQNADSNSSGCVTVNGTTCIGTRDRGDFHLFAVGNTWHQQSVGLSVALL